MDPITILFAANACVAAIKEGCELYKQAKSSFMEVKSTVEEAIGVAKEVKGFWSKLFGSKPTTQASKPVAKKKDKYVAVDETQVMVNVVSQLTEFFKLQEQANEGVIYAQKILKEEAKIDWQKDAVEIDRLIRAFSPSPGAYTYLNQALLKIGLSENILREVSSNDQVLAGQIIQINEDGILVAGQRGVLRILEVQRPGAKKISAALFAKTVHLEVGQCFSSEP